MLLACPNCSAIWGFDEIQFQQCDCCGYPNIDDEENDFDPDNFEDDFDELSEDNNPNDSRNL